MSQSKSTNKQTGFGGINSNFSSNAFNSTNNNKKTFVKNFNNSNVDGFKTDTPVNKKLQNSKSNVNMKNAADTSNSDGKGIKKK